jgi:PIN domain nuclease of toxin-antitoxin system
MDKFVLDACAVLALIKEEQGMDIVRNAIESDAETFLHSVTFLEIYYNLMKEFDVDSANLFYKNISQTNVNCHFSFTPAKPLRKQCLAGCLNQNSKNSGK